jgi:hypothetical protein
MTSVCRQERGGGGIPQLQFPEGLRPRRKRVPRCWIALTFRDSAPELETSYAANGLDRDGERRYVIEAAGAA